MIYRISLQNSATHFNAGKDENVLGAALRHKVFLAYGCRNGSCGICKAQVIAGSYQCAEHGEEALTNAERAAGYTVLCRTHATSDMVIAASEIKGINGFLSRRLPARVETIEPLNHNVVRLILKLPGGQRLQYVAGQYIDILLRDGKKRSFSIANAPSAPGNIVELHFQRHPGSAFSERAIAQLQVKSILRIEGPFGQFYWRGDSDRMAILIAGGTGFAPIKALLEDRFAHQEKNSLHLYWGVRAQRDFYLHNLIHTWQQTQQTFTFVPVLSEPDPNDSWDGRRGWVHETVLADWPNFSQVDVYSCGPPPMVRAIRDEALIRGLPPDRFFCDLF